MIMIMMMMMLGGVLIRERREMGGREGSYRIYIYEVLESVVVTGCLIALLSTWIEGRN